MEWMYAMLVNGSTAEEIAGVLTELQIPTGGRRKDGSLNTNWTGSGVLTGFISMNRSWAGFDAEDYYRAAQIAMGLLDEELDDDLGNEFLSDGGHRLEGLIDDHGISRIARELTEAEQRVKDEMDGIDRSKQELAEQAETVRTFQVVSGEMFSHIHEPIDELLYAYWLGYIYRCECIMHDESSRMVYSAFTEDIMRDAYKNIVSSPLNDKDLSDCAKEICVELDRLLVEEIWPQRKHRRYM